MSSTMSSPTRVFWCFFGAGLLACLSGSSLHPVILDVSLGQPVTLPCLGAASSDIDWCFKQDKGNQLQLVVKFRDGGSSPGPHFDGRVKSVPMNKQGNYGFTLDPMEFNDGGIYRCKDNNDNILSVVKLHVSVPSLVSAVRGESAILPCYGNINKATGVRELNVRWMKDGKKVYQLRNGNATYGPGFENRVSLSPDRALQGDLSLDITQTRLSDQGDYWCFYDSPEENGQPPTIRLLVAVSPPVDSSLHGGTVAAIVLGVSLAVVLLALAIVLLALAILIKFRFIKLDWSAFKPRANGEEQNDTKIPMQEIMSSDRVLKYSVEEGQKNQTQRLLSKTKDLQADGADGADPVN